MHDFDIHPGFCAHGRGLCSSHHAVEQLNHLLFIRVAHVIINLSGFRHDVRRITAIGNDVMQASGLRYVLAHQIYHKIHRFHAIQCRPPLIWCRRCVGRSTREGKASGLIRRRTGGRRRVTVTGMPVQHHIHCVEHPGSGQIDFTGTPLFGRRSHQFDRCTHLGVLQPMTQRHRRCGGCGTEQMMPAGMTCRAFFGDPTKGQSRLIQAGQGIKFRQ